MHLLDCLSRTPSDQFGRIALSAGLEPVEDRSVLERILANRLIDPARLQGLLSDLSDEEWSALKVVFFNGRDQGITTELCHQIVNLLSGKRRKSPARSLDDLQNRGLIFTRTVNYRQVFFIPDDLLAALSEILNRHMVCRVCLPVDAVVRPAPPYRDLMEDAHRFLAYAYKTEITLTQQGQIFKRHLRALLDLLGSDTDEEESLVGRYPEPLGLLVGYALDRRLLAREEARLHPTSKLEGWLGETRGFKQADLFGYWQDRYSYQDLQTFLSVMRQVGQDWVSTNRLVAELESLINPSQRGSFLLRLKHHISTFLSPIGLVELGEAGTPEEPDLACRLTATGAAVLDGRSPQPGVAGEQPGFLLQATFEIIAPRPVEASVLWMLELMADLAGRTDRTLTYRLSRQSVYRALKTGLSGHGMLGFLQEHSTTGVPQNVAFDLAAWADSYGQVYLQAVMLLRCASAVLAEQIKASRRTARYVLGELGPTDLIVDEEHYLELLDALEADGLMPRPTVERSAPGDRRRRDA